MADKRRNPAAVRICVTVEEWLDNKFVSGSASLSMPLPDKAEDLDGVVSASLRSLVTSARREYVAEISKILTLEDAKKDYEASKEYYLTVAKEQGKEVTLE